MKLESDNPWDGLPTEKELLHRKLTLLAITALFTLALFGIPYLMWG